MRILIALLAFLMLLGSQAHAACPAPVGQVYTAVDCSAAEVQSCMDAATASGDTVVIPAGTCTWSGTSNVNWTAPASATLRGSGSLTTIGGGDSTIIADNSSYNELIKITISAGSTFRLAGLTVREGTGGAKEWGVIAFAGSGTLRIDHNHIDYNSTSNAKLIVIAGSAIYGVIDSNIFDVYANNAIYFYNTRGAGAAGNEVWNAVTDFGGSTYMFVENNKFIGTTAYASRMGDCYSGGKLVLRYNDLTGVAGPEQHATGHAGDDRGCRSMEVYRNHTYDLADQSGNPVMMANIGGGTALVWGNELDVGSVSNLILWNVTRKNDTTYVQVVPPNGWGYCGTEFNGTGSAWDERSDTAKGYACIDQPGRGRGDLLQGDFPSKCNKTLNAACDTFTGQYPRQDLEPIYTWANTLNGITFHTDNTNGRISADVDYYQQASGVQVSSSSPFNGTTGAGWGTLANRPTTCTTGVGYFATNQGTLGTLYKCSATDTWASYYTPYTCPHPSTGYTGTCGTGAGTAYYNITGAQFSIGTGISSSGIKWQ